MTWVGKEIPSPIWKTPPVFHVEGKTGYILVHNVQLAKWESKQFAKIAQPYDVYVVLRDLQAVVDEGYFAVGLGLRNRGNTSLELSTTSANGSGADNQLMAAALEFNKMSIVRMRFDGANSKIWINNVQVSPVMPNTTGTNNTNQGIKNGGISQLGYGTVSHAAQHDFFGMWVKFGTIPDSDHAAIYKTLSDFYGAGQYPDKPFPNKVKAVWNNTAKQWVAQYEYNGINPEDLTKTQYQWGYHIIAEDLDNTTFFPVEPNSTGKALVRANYPTIITQPGQTKVKIFVSVKVFDNKGESWNHFVRSEFAYDNN